ncbi:iron-containing alcohol dehydrogenase [Streptomyces sp. NPDC055722]
METAIRTYDPSTVGRVVHGVGALGEVPALLREIGSKRLVVVTSKSIIERTDWLDRLGKLVGDRLAAVASPIGPHTPVADVAGVEKTSSDVGADAILAFGGSSVADGAKIAALRLGGATLQTVITNGVVESAASGFTERPVPLIVVPTTLSAGEYTHGAGMIGDGHGGKIVTMDDRMPPWAVVLDPEVTLATPSELWLSTGVKAVDHAAETIWGAKSHPMGDAISSAALPLLIESLTITARNPEDLDARLQSQLAAWMSVATMKNTSLHLSHILEHCMGTYWHLSHGITSCVALPTVMEYLTGESPAKVARVARALKPDAGIASDDEHVARETAQWLREWVGQIGLPDRLRDVVPDRSGFDDVAHQAVLELSVFGYIPVGGADTIKMLLDRMW